jgi:mRNA-degrading endonuclease RelE of RelBE toxin-antitoxin system
MNYNLAPIAPFKRQAKRLTKKFPSLIKEIENLSTLLRKNPTAGTPIGQNCYKIRMAIASKGKGKSGGARIITHFHFTGQTIFLLSIYDKSERSDISDKEISDLLKLIF